MSKAASRKRVFLVNELGAGSGHARTLFHLSDAFTAEGYECKIGLPAATIANFVPRAARKRIVEWPRPERDPRHANVYAGSYADILAIVGFDDSQRLKAFIENADRAFAAAQPDLIVTDFAPVAMLAAAGKCPVLWVGHSYSTPPLDAPRFDRFRREEALAADEDRLHEIILRIQSERGAPYFSDLPGAFVHARQMVCCSREADFYAQTRIGPVVGHRRRFDPRPSAPRADRIVGYLHGDHYALRTLIDGLVAARRDTLLHVPNPPDWLDGHIRGTSILLTAEPLSIPNDLQKATLVLHAGGANLTEEVLSLGIPQLVAPMQIEQHLIAARLSRYGLVRVLASGFHASDVHARIDAALSEECRALCEAHSRKMQSDYPAGALPSIVAAANDLLS